jgi:hypothetical protein
MKLFDALGFRWDRSVLPDTVPVHSVERALFRFHKMLPAFVWDAAVLEGNPFTLPEVQTLMDGVTVGGRKVSDQAQVLNLIDSAQHLLRLVKDQQFCLSKAVFTELNGLVARGESLEWGVFRGEGEETRYSPAVHLGEHGLYHPLPTLPRAEALNAVFNEGVAALQTCEPFERATACFLFGALQQFFFDGNKRTSRFMMNGILLSHGMDAISVPAAKLHEFNENMVRFYRTKDATGMMDFLVRCHPDAEVMFLPPENTVDRDDSMEP